MPSGHIRWELLLRSKKEVKKAADAAEAIGIGLQAFCIPGSVAEQGREQVFLFPRGA